MRVFAPLPGIVHSYGDNQGKGDYGPTVILEHTLENTKFYTLYGHLDRSSLCEKMEGAMVSAGAQIGIVGTYPENGDYPSHLHFEIVTDMCGKIGDFPGVCAKKEIDTYRLLCPDPNGILQIPP